MKKNTKRLLSLMLSLILVVGMIPGTMTAYAAAGDPCEIVFAGNDEYANIVGENIATEGTDYTCTINPKPGYKWSSLIVKYGSFSSSFTEGTEYTFDETTGKLIIKGKYIKNNWIYIFPYFTEDTSVTLYDIVFEGSNASFSGESKAVAGEKYTCTLTATTGYELQSVIVKRAAVDTITDKCTFDNTTGLLTIPAEELTGMIQIWAVTEKILSEYTITLPTGTGFTSAAAATYESLKVVEGKDFRFTVTITDGYKATGAFKVKANGVELTKDGTGYVISNITADQVITVEGVEALPEYTVTLPNGTGFTSAAAATYESLKVVEGKEFRFVVSITDGYRATSAFKVKANGVELTKDGTGYVINNITADQVITVEGVEALPEYTVTLPNGNGVTAAPAATYTTSVVEGKDFRFVVSIVDGYKATSAFAVKANGVAVAKDGDVYVIPSVTENITITVEGVEKLPEYTVTLPNGNGVTAAPAATYTTSVVEGKDFRFVVSIVDGYRATSAFAVKANGAVVTKSGDVYVIENVTENITITVEGVEKLPEYTVTLPNGNGVTAAPAATYTTSVVEGKDFRFVVSIVDGYRATADFKVKANGVEVAKDGGIYVIENVLENQVVTVEGVEKIPSGDTDNPQTGDNSMIWLWIALLFVSIAGVVATVYGKKRFSVK